MADSSLDDFFAKKDKSKKSKSKKYNNNATQSDETRKLSEKGLKKDKDRSNPMNNTSAFSEKPDEEWHEYNEQEKDYSGLKIQSLQISEKEDMEKDGDKDFDEDGEPINSKDGPAGPWKFVKKAPEFNEPEKKEPVVEEKEKEVKAYVIPALKKSRADLDKVPMGRRSKLPPRIDWQSDFPSLSSAVDSTNKSDSNIDGSRFEQVKNRSRGRDDLNNKNVGPKLDLGNKYNALGADHL